MKILQSGEIFFLFSLGLFTTRKHQAYLENSSIVGQGVLRNVWGAREPGLALSPGAGTRDGRDIRPARDLPGGLLLSYPSSSKVVTPIFMSISLENVM